MSKLIKIDTDYAGWIKGATPRNNTNCRGNIVGISALYKKERIFLCSALVFLYLCTQISKFTHYYYGTRRRF